MATNPKRIFIKVKISATLIKLDILKKSLISVLLVNLNSDININSIAEIPVIATAVHIKTQSIAPSNTGTKAIIWKNNIIFPMGVGLNSLLISL